MGKFSTRNLRFLHLLALFQWVAGPWVLFQVTVLCKLTVWETPRNGAATVISETGDGRLSFLPAQLPSPRIQL